MDFHWLERNIPCQAACPAGTDIPGYLEAISRGDFDGAYRINLADNVFPAVLGRVCARPCEAPCRHSWPGLGEPVAICFSKRSAATFQRAAEPVLLPPLFGPTGRRVAVVGAGAAGLAAARELARCGHAVTVYERHARPGGMMRLGIPAFRLPREHVDREIRQVEAQGVAIRCGVEVGREPSLARLAAEHDAVIVAAGTLKPNVPAWPGADLAGVEHGLPFLMAVNERGRAAVGRRVAVIGGGFTAMDCARVALRLGAEAVTLYYRRSLDEIHVTPGEREELEHEGIPIRTLVAPRAILGREGRVTGLRFVRTRLGEPDADGRRRAEEIAGSEFEEEADHVLVATGQAADDTVLGCARDALPAKVFLAGDFAMGASTLIDAIGHAKGVALRVDAFLTGRIRVADAVRIEPGRAAVRTREMDFVPRQPMPALPLDARSAVAEVETGHTEEGARTEAHRCYLCHYKYEIDMTRCIYCNQCVEVKPRPDCIVRVRALREDAAGRIQGWEPKADDLRPGAPGFEYYINQADCIRCNACLEVCPVRCIGVQKVAAARVTRD